MSNQDRYRPGHPRRARIAQTPRKPPIHQAGALRGARPEGSGSELEEHGFVSILV